MPTILSPLLVSVLASLAASAPGAGPPARAPDPDRGEAIYVGRVPLIAGGAPCLGCHGIAGHGLSRAASFGPDLSGAHASFGADGLEAMLEDIIFPSMQPVYRGHAVTKEERADLIAFLSESTGAPPAKLGGGFLGGVAAAMGLFLAAVVAVGKRGSGRRERVAAGRGRTP